MKSACAIDLGNGAVKFVRLTKRGRRVRVASFAVFPIEGEKGERDALARLVEEQHLAGQKVALSLPASSVHLRNIDSPLTQEEAIRSTIKSQVEPLVPVDIDSAVVDFMRLSSVGSGESAVRLLVSVLPKAVLREKLDMLNSAGLRAVRVGINVTDACTAMKTLPHEEERVLLVDLGAKTCNLALLDPMGPIQARACRLGSPGARLMNAEEIERHSKKIADEIGRMLKGIGAGQPNRILLTGGGSMAAGAAESLGRLLPYPLSTTDLGAAFMPDADEETQHKLNRLGLAAFGAAYALLLAPDKTPDLLREEFAQPGLLKTTRRPLALCAITVLLACLAGNILLFLSAAAARQRLHATSTEMRDLWHRVYPNTPPPPDIAAQIHADGRQLALQAQDSMLPGRESTIDLLLDLVKLMPRDKIGEVRRVNISQETVQMDLQTTSFSAAQDIVEAINRSDRFSANVKDLKPIGDNTFACQLVVAIKGRASHG